MGQTFNIISSLLLVVSLNGYSASGWSGGLNPQVRFCRAAALANLNNDPSLHFFSVKLEKGDEAAFCEFRNSAVGYQTLYDRVQNNTLNLAVQNYWLTYGCQNDSSQCFQCSSDLGCNSVVTERIFDNGNRTRFEYFLFSDGSSMERETMLKGSGHVDNFELNRALSKRNLNY